MLLRSDLLILVNSGLRMRSLFPLWLGDGAARVRRGTGKQ